MFFVPIIVATRILTQMSRRRSRLRRARKDKDRDKDCDEDPQKPLISNRGNVVQTTSNEPDFVPRQAFGTTSGKQPITRPSRGASARDYAKRCGQANNQGRPPAAPLHRESGLVCYLLGRSYDVDSPLVADREQRMTKRAVASADKFISRVRDL